MKTAHGPTPSSRVGDLFKSSLITKVYSLLTEHSLWAEQNLGLLEHFGEAVPNDPQILDLGSGTGIGTRAIARSLAGRGHVHGLDFSSEMVAIATEGESLPNLSFSQGDATQMNVPDDSMDFVVANSFLYLVPQRLAVLKEVLRVLRPKGRVVFMEPREEGSLPLASLHALGHLMPMASRPIAAMRMGAAMLAWRTMSGIEGRPSLGELRDLFQEAGFPQVAFIPALGGIGHFVVASQIAAPPA